MLNSLKSLFVKKSSIETNYAIHTTTNNYTVCQKVTGATNYEVLTFIHKVNDSLINVRVKINGIEAINENVNTIYNLNTWKINLIVANVEDQMLIHEAIKEAKIEYVNIEC